MPNNTLAIDSVTGVYPLDVDGDGLMDVDVLRVGENILFKGKGNCQFERANEAWNFDGGNVWLTAFSATWEKDKNWPTLAIGNYVDRTAQGFPWGRVMITAYTARRRRVLNLPIVPLNQVIALC